LENEKKSYTIAKTLYCVQLLSTHYHNAEKYLSATNIRNFNSNTFYLTNSMCTVQLYDIYLTGPTWVKSAHGDWLGGDSGILDGQMRHSVTHLLI
jgi:hypothetical protein